MSFYSNGVWMLLAFVFTISYTNGSKFTVKEKVALSWRTDGNHLCLVCNVNNLSLGVSFRDPHGNIRGHCTAPIPHTVAGHCDTHLKQNIYNETTVLTVDRIDCENGIWKCFHGENTKEYASTAVSLSTDSNQQKPKDSTANGTVTNGQRYKCTLFPLIFGFAISLVGSLVYLTFLNRTSTCQQVRNLCGEENLMKYTGLRVVLPFSIVLILPVGLMFIPGICQGSWWILFATVGVIITLVYPAALEFKERCMAEITNPRNSGNLEPILPPLDGH